jgi:aspartate/methionine/tyrosine aminotransferase
MHLNPAFAATVAPPVMEARRWLSDTPPPAHLPLINVSQAAPVEPPPESLRRAMADAILTVDETHLYGPDLGLPALRAELASQISAVYGAQVSDTEVAITAGCNQAFAAICATLAGPGDAVMLPAPWYFNHKMWLDMTGVGTQVLPTGPDLLPDPERAATLITPQTRAIALTSPNNPGGVEYPPALLRAFYDLAKLNNIALIVDETYRDFHSSDAAPHDLFQDPDWADTLVHLYSFSKAFRLTGHRVGALATSKARLAEVEKFIDTVAICPPQVGQVAALWGLQNLMPWVAEQRAEILSRRDAMRAAFDALPGWDLMGCGAYFGYGTHPFTTEPSDKLAQRLVRDHGILLLPGTMFAPTLAQGGDGSAERQLRIAFANIDSTEIKTLAARLAEVRA